jgi:hypothetical protein
MHTNSKGKGFEPMPTTDWIIGELERIILEAKRPSTAPFSAGGGAAPRPSSGGGGGDWLRGKVTYWNVEEKEGPKGPYVKARVGISWVQDGERQSEFLSTLNRELIERIDPLNKGDLVEYKVLEKGKYRDLEDLRLSTR